MLVSSLLPGLTFQIMTATLAPLFPGVAQGQNALASQITTFLNRNPSAFETDLKRNRPVVTPQLRAANLASFLESLPEDGEVKTLSLPERHNLDSLDRVLNAYGGLYQIRILNMPQSVIGLYRSTVLWISQPALTLLNEEELLAAVAHEMGHAYVWDETRSAQETRNYSRLKEIEIFCDAVAIIILRQANVHPSSLIASVDKLNQFNQHRFGAALNSASYPTIDARRRSAAKVMKWLRQARD